MATPPDAMTAASDARSTSVQQGEVRPAEQAVAGDRGDDKGRDALRAEDSERVDDRRARRSGHPAVTHGPAVADIEGGGDPPGAVAIHELTDEARAPEGGRPEHDARCAAVQGGLHGGGVAETAGNLDLHRRALPGFRGRDSDFSHLDVVGPLTRPCPVEVDDVDPAGPGRPEGPRDGRRIVAVDLLAVERRPAAAARLARRGGRSPG